MKFEFKFDLRDLVDNTTIDQIDDNIHNLVVKTLENKGHDPNNCTWSHNIIIIVDGVGDDE